MELNRAKKLLSKIESDLEPFENLQEIDHDYMNPEERFEANQIMQIADNLNEAIAKIKYLSKPIRAKGILTKRSDGRFGIAETEIYFTSGSSIEIWDDEDKQYYTTTIEHTNGDYYAVSFPGVSLEGTAVRAR